MVEVRRVNPFRCRVWEQHGRIEEYITETSCKDEIQSMKEHGQLVPAIVRLVQNDPMYDVEVICGARRLFAARCLNIELLAEVRPISDREGIVLMDIENRQRRDWSAYERGKSFASWLSAGHFESQDDLARALKISNSQVSRLLKVAKLPTIIVEAFADPGDICETWGLDLYHACEDSGLKPRVIERARALKRQHNVLRAREVFDRLRSLGRSGTAVRSRRQEVVFGVEGQTLFRIKHHDRAVSLFIDKQHVSPASLSRIKEALVAILQDANPEVAILKGNFSSLPALSVAPQQ